jgi:hypothetical protein
VAESEVDADQHDHRQDENPGASLRQRQKSVPLQGSQLIEVQVAAGEDDRDA